MTTTQNVAESGMEYEKDYNMSLQRIDMSHKKAVQWILQDKNFTHMYNFKSLLKNSILWLNNFFIYETAARLYDFYKLKANQKMFYFLI